MVFLGLSRLLYDCLLIGLSSICVGCPYCDEVVEVVSYVGSSLLLIKHCNPSTYTVKEWVHNSPNGREILLCYMVWCVRMNTYASLFHCLDQ